MKMEKNEKKCHGGAYPPSPLPPHERPKYGVLSVDDTCISKISFRNYLILWITFLKILLFHSTWNFKIYFFQKNYCKKKLIKIFFFF